MCIRDSLSDAYLGNGSVAWRIPDYEKYPEIKPHYVDQYKGEDPWMPYMRDPETLVRYWSIPVSYTHLDVYKRQLPI